MKTPNCFSSNVIRAIFLIAFAFTSMSVSAFPLPPAGTPLLGDPQFQACFDEQAMANDWASTEDVTLLSCPSRGIRDLAGLEVFTNLLDLNLSHNQIEFAFPIDQLTQLEVLNLSHNRLQDINPLNSLFNLRELYLSGNRPSDTNAPGVSLVTVNPVIQNNIELTHLGVGGMPIDYLDQLATFDLSQVFSQKLIDLDIRNTGISDVYALSRAPFLRVLNASGNQLQSTNGIDQLPQLEVLDLSHNPLFDVYQLRFIQSLKQLNLSSNRQLLEDQVRAIVLNNPGLTHLSLAEIRLPNLDWLPVPGQSGQFDLVELDISHSGNFVHLNQLNQYPNLRLLRAAGNGLEDLWPLGNLMQLEVLDLSDNKLPFIYALDFLNNLTQLNLSGNNRLQASNVTSVIQSNPALTHLGVSGISLGDLNWLPAPGPQGQFSLQELDISEIGNLVDLGQVSQYPELRVLKASGNKLQGMWGGALLPQLQVLDVSDNQLSNLFELQFNTSLSQLNLSGNTRLPFNEVQAMIQNNPGLTHIGIAEIKLNDLQWLPPVGPQGEHDLLELDISNTGDYFDLGILDRYPNLRVLKAAGNHLRIAYPVGQLSQLEVLDLSSNQLWDIVALQSLTRLRELNLSDNQSSDIYSPGIDLVTLNQVIGNNPDITHLGVGGVPIGRLDQLATFSSYSTASIKLVELDVSNTGIDNADPIATAQNLRALRASGNQLDATHFLYSLTQLEVLDLSHNRLYDIVTLGNLNSLRQLNLSGNHRLQLADVQNVVYSNFGLTHLGLADIRLSNISWLPGGSSGVYDLIELDISNTGSYDDLIPLESYFNLRVLKAAGNRVSSVLGIQQLSQLEVLDLSSNNLQDIYPMFPLASLRQLDLSGNSGLLPADVQAFVHANPELTHISVAGITFGSAAWLPDPGPQGEFDLLEIDISNTFSNYSILTDVHEYPNLRVLRAAGNGLNYMPGIDFLTRLEELDLNDNQLWEASHLLALHDLRRLNLSGNNALQLAQVKAIVEGNSGLTHLGVAGIAMPDLNWLPQVGPQGEYNLQDLDVSNTGLLDLGVLSRYPDLRVLRASGNQLKTIYFGQLMPIEVLDLSNNQLWDVFALSDLDNLRELYLSGNQPSDPNLPGVDLATVNQVINDNPELTHLGLGGVPIGDLNRLPLFGPGNEVGLNLVELDISNTGITDFFRILELPALQVLNVSGNQIIDSFVFTLLLQLTELDLSNNDLEYVLPLGDLVNLSLLDLRGNNNTQCAELDELELRLTAEVLLRPASCIVGLLPSVNILSPAQGANYYSTEQIFFMAVAGDFEDADLSGQIQWSSDLTGPIGTGHMFDLALSAGDHVITASVVDSDGNAASHSVTISIETNTAPTVTIDSVQDGAVFQAGDSVVLSGTAMDTEEGDISPTIQWQSSRNGAIGVGASIQVPLDPGDHTISASVTDGTGATTVTTVSLRINELPYLALLAPADDSIFQQGDTVGLAASANDPEDGDLGDLIQWSSDLEGSIGNGTQINSILVVGEHRITASITDRDGATNTRTITVIINSLPQIELISPASGSLFMLQEAVKLGATADDAEDGDISGIIQWSSNLDGNLGSGGLLTTNLSLGTHSISASVTDSAGGIHIVSTEIVVDQIDLDVTVSGTGTRQKATLIWSGSRTDVDIYKDGRLRRTGDPSGTRTFRFKNQAVFKVCEQGTDYCSVDVTVQTN